MPRKKKENLTATEVNETTTIRVDLKTYKRIQKAKEVKRAGHMKAVSYNKVLNELLDLRDKILKSKPVYAFESFLYEDVAVARGKSVVKSATDGSDIVWPQILIEIGTADPNHE